MNNIDEMMTMWKEMDKKLSSLENENRQFVEVMKKYKLKNNQEKITRKYRIFIILEAMCIPLMVAMLLFFPMVADEYRWPALIVFVGFLLLEIVVDGYLLYKLENIDFYNDSIVEISRLARRNWKIHKIAILAGIPMAICAVILLGLALGGETSFLWGMFVGGTIGLGIGLNEFFKFMKNYKNLSRGV